MTTGNILILGARSKISMAIAHRFAMGGYNIQLAARNANNLNLDRLNIEETYKVSVTLHEFDILETSSHPEFVDQLHPNLPDITVCVVGYMGKQSESEKDLWSAMRVTRSNYEGPLIILGELAQHFERRGSGIIVGISSVAGDRGRAKNYIYGSAKAGFTAFLSGLRNRLSRKGVHVITVIPGYVETKSTSNLDLPKKLLAKPEEVADSIFKAIRKRRDVVYVRPIWRLIMFIIRSIPETMFKWTRI